MTTQQVVRTPTRPPPPSYPQNQLQQGQQVVNQQVQGPGFQQKFQMRPRLQNNQQQQGLKKILLNASWYNYFDTYKDDQLDFKNIG